MQLTIIYFPPNINRPFPFPFPLQEIFPESPSSLPGLFSFLTLISSVSLLLVLCVSSGRMLPNECVAGRWGGGRFYTTPEPVHDYHRRGRGGGGGGGGLLFQEGRKESGRGRKAWIQTRPRFPPCFPAWKRTNALCVSGGTQLERQLCCVEGGEGEGKEEGAWAAVVPCEGRSGAGAGGRPSKASFGGTDGAHCCCSFPYPPCGSYGNIEARQIKSPFSSSLKPHHMGVASRL